MSFINQYSPTDKPNNDTIYFAAKPAKDTAEICLQRAQSFYNLLIYQPLILSYSFYYKCHKKLIETQTFIIFL